VDLNAREVFPFYKIINCLVKRFIKEAQDINQGRVDLQEAVRQSKLLYLQAQQENTLICLHEPPINFSLMTHACQRVNL